tara:strand:- start:201 stop:713 length:513 start_codon:yes stop_codon:yes gene_type:complete
MGNNQEIIENKQEEKSWFKIWLENFFKKDGWEKIEDKIDDSFYKKIEHLKRYKNNNVNNSWYYDIQVVDENSHRCGISPYFIDKLIHGDYKVEIYSQIIDYDTTKKKIYGLKIVEGNNLFQDLLIITYIIEEGDTISSICKYFNVSYEKILKYNNNKIEVIPGNKLYIPK